MDRLVEPMDCLVDTNVLSDLARPEPNPGVVLWSQSVAQTGISIVSVEEIYFGLSWNPRAAIQGWFQRFLQEHCEIYPVTAEIARKAGELRGQLRATGIVRTQADMLIAATAVAHGVNLVTRNEKDFQGCGIAVLNPFSEDDG